MTAPEFDYGERTLREIPRDPGALRSYIAELEGSLSQSGKISDRVGRMGALFAVRASTFRKEFLRPRPPQGGS